jgi:hypothetical protein
VNCGRGDARAKLVSMIARCVALLTCAGLLGCWGGSASVTPAADASVETSPSVDAVDISGWFQVGSYADGPCGATVTDTLLAPAYLWVEKRQSTFIFNACSGTTEASCTGTLFYDFTQPIDNGWAAEGGSAFFSAGCTLDWERTQATLNGNELHAQSLRDSVVNNVAESACTADAARMLTGPCTYEVDLIATRM